MAFLAPIGVFLAANAGAVAAVGAAATIGTGVFTAVSQKQAADSEQAAYEQNAEIQRQIGERNAKLVDIEGEAARKELLRDRARRIGAARAAMGAGGYQLTGSPLDVLAGEYAQTARDIGYLGYNTAVARQNALLGGAIASRTQLLDASAAQNRGNAAYGSLLGGFAESVPDIYDAFTLST